MDRDRDRDSIFHDRKYGPSNDIPPPNLIGPGPPPIQIQAKRKPPRKQPPQDSVKLFWDKFNAKYPGKVFTILPDNPYARKKVAKASKEPTTHSHQAVKSYDEAAAACIRNVERIVKECKRVNQRYRDPHFDIEFDLKQKKRDYLDGLDKICPELAPRGVKRVTDIFEKPEFYINGPSAGDVRQGRQGDCYLMAALCGLGNMPGLIEKVCVARDEKVGVYGFLFYRDGDWHQTIIDDKLYLRAADYDEAQKEREIWDEINRTDTEHEYKKVHQTGSRALYFASCSDENETWLPLLEKAWAKAHGDYTSIDGGFTGEAIEDLTGGVTSEFYSTDILDKEEFWNLNLMKVGKDFLFGCATGFYSSWLETAGKIPPPPPRERQGITENHAYSIMEAVEHVVDGKTYRLVKLRNPWGRKEWDGKWSDGSAEWTAEWLQLLKHKFGNDGVFWISYEDLLRKYQHFDRTRIFGPEWHVTQQWTSVQVPWTGDYHSTWFRLTLKEKSPVVIVFSQLDESYFGGLQGCYSFTLQFRVSKEGDDEEDYIVRSHGNYAMNRSVSTDITLESGVWCILMKITATPNGDGELEDALPIYAERRPEKLLQMGLSYDLAHAKGVVVETEEEKQQREVREKARKAKEWEKRKAKAKEQKRKNWEWDKANFMRQKRHTAKRRGKRKAQKPSADESGSQFDGSLDVANGSLAGDSKDRLGEPKPPTVIHSLPGDIIDFGLDRPHNEAEATDEAEAMPDTEQDSVAAPDSRDVTKQLADSEEAPDAEQTSIRAAVSADADRDPHHSVTPQVEPTPKAPQVEQGDRAQEVVQPLSSVVAQADAYSSHVTPAHDDLPPPPIVQVNGVGAITNVVPFRRRPPRAPPEADLTFSAVRALPRQNSGNESGLDSADEGSFTSFSWDSDLDFPPSSSSDDSPPPSPIQRDHFVPPHRRRPPRRRDGAPGMLKLDHLGLPDDEDSQVGKHEPWNAVCVVGLRVYSVASGEDVKLEVVRPAEGYDDKEEGKMAEEKGTPAVAVLDRDDSAKGAMVGVE